MKADLLLIANAAIARLFSREPHQQVLLPIETLEHPESRLRSSELGDGRAGHGSADHRAGGVAFEPRLEAQRKQQLQFAEQVALCVEQELASGRFAGLVLFASSPFLGELKQSLGPAALKALRSAIGTDLTSFPVDEVQRRVDAALRAEAGR